MSGESPEVTSDTLVTHTDAKGRTLSGMGADAEKLAEVTERHAPPPEPKDTPATGGSAAPAATGAEAVAPAAPVSRGRQRFSDLTRERDEAKAAAETAKQERERIEREYTEFRSRASQPAPAQQPQQTPQQPAQPQYTRPEPDVNEIGTKYETYEQFARDLARWEIEQYHVQQQATWQQTIDATLTAREQQRQFNQTVQSVQERGRKAYRDFDAKLSSPAGQIPLGPSPDEAIRRAQFIVAHPQSEHIQYAILSDAALAQRLQQADPYTFAATIAGLVQPQQQQQRPAWTPPPPPNPTVGASSQTTATSSADIAAKGDYEAYRARRAAERGVKPRFR